MKPANVIKLQKLLWMDVKPSHQDGFRDMENTVYITPSHTTAIEVSKEPQINPDTVVKYDGENESNFNLGYRKTQLKTRTVINREWLVKVLQNMDSDAVIIETDTDMPIRVKGSLEDRYITATICPRIDNEGATDSDIVMRK